MIFLYRSRDDKENREKGKKTINPHRLIEIVGATMTLSPLSYSSTVISDFSRFRPRLTSLDHLKNMEANTLRVNSLNKVRRAKRGSI